MLELLYIALISSNMQVKYAVQALCIATSFPWGSAVGSASCRGQFLVLKQRDTVSDKKMVARGENHLSF